MCLVALSGCPYIKSSRWCPFHAIKRCQTHAPPCCTLKASELSTALKAEAHLEPGLSVGIRPLVLAKLKGPFDHKRTFCYFVEFAVVEFLALVLPSRASDKPFHPPSLGKEDMLSTFNLQSIMHKMTSKQPESSGKHIDEAHRLCEIRFVVRADL